MKSSVLSLNLSSVSPSLANSFLTPSGVGYCLRKVVSVFVLKVSTSPVTSSEACGSSVAGGSENLNRGKADPSACSNSGSSGKGFGVEILGVDVRLVLVDVDIFLPLPVGRASRDICGLAVLTFSAGCSPKVLLIRGSCV